MTTNRRRLFVLLALLLSVAVAALGPPHAQAEQRMTGVLLLAHGSHRSHGAAHGHHQADEWNGNVEELVRHLDRRRPTEVAFGMADPSSIQAAVERLEARGVTRITAVPLFVSSHSPIIGNFRYVLGLQDSLASTTRIKHLDRIRSRADIAFVGAMDAHPLVGEILLERALGVGTDPAGTSVILIAHGPNDEGENRLWLRDMEVHAATLRERGGFRHVGVLTHRNDAPPEVKAEARATFREQVERASEMGVALVIPLLLSSGGIERQVEADLAGLPYVFTRPLMPHPNIELWVEAMVEASEGEPRVLFGCRPERPEPHEHGAGRRAC
jgi:sirohydrochlorin cobaltochelatase